MTREETILAHINLLEKRLERGINTQNAKRIDDMLTRIDEAHRILKMLGYEAVEDESSAKSVGGVWINRYTAIKDVR